MSQAATPNDVSASTLAVLREVCRQPNLVASLDTGLDEIADLDSLSVMEAVALLESRFGVEVDTGALNHLGTVGDIVDLVTRALSRQAAG